MELRVAGVLSPPSPEDSAERATRATGLSPVCQQLDTKNAHLARLVERLAELARRVEL